jgi:adenine-specific DNA-methyltransferase
LVLDITCGSGTTAQVAEQWGRRWITCDTSRIAIALAKQRMLTATFDYYGLARHDEGISGGFRYKSVPHITLKSIANNEPSGVEVLFDQASIDDTKSRVTGPFTVESIPAPFVKNLDDETGGSTVGDESVTRTGETLRQDQWRDELQRTGARGKGGAI